MERPRVWGPKGKPTCPTPTEIEREHVRFRILSEQLEEGLPDSEIGWCWYMPKGGHSKIMKRCATAEEIVAVKNWLAGMKETARDREPLGRAISTRGASSFSTKQK